VVLCCSVCFWIEVVEPGLNTSHNVEQEVVILGSMS
jgi:hypothetical protein